MISLVVSTPGDQRVKKQFNKLAIFSKNHLLHTLKATAVACYNYVWISE